MKFIEDDRAQRLIDIFDISRGQINVSFVNSTDHIVAWHMHELQTDYWVCIKGSFKVGLAKDKDNWHFDYLSDKAFRVLEIVPGIYHGYRALERGSILLYYLNKRYNPQDEKRLSPGCFGEDWRTVDK